MNQKNIILINNILNYLQNFDICITLPIDFQYYVEDALDYIMIKIYEKLEDKLINFEQCDKIFDIISREFSLSKDKIYKRIEWLRKLELTNLKLGLKLSHQQVIDVFDQVNKLFNESEIDYYHTGGILSYLLIDKPLERYHHDIDVFINVDHMNYLKTLENQSFKYIERLSRRNEYTERLDTKLYYSDIDIPISIFWFRRLEDGSIQVEDYYIYNDGTAFYDYSLNSKSCVSLSFDNNIHFHNGIRYKSITKEALFQCKNSNRYKDKYDCHILKPYINKMKLHLLEQEKIENYSHIELSDESLRKIMYLLHNKMNGGSNEKIKMLI